MWTVTSPEAKEIDIPGSGATPAPSAKRRRLASVTSYEPATWLQRSGVGPLLFRLAGLGDCDPWCYKESLLANSDAKCPFGCSESHANAWSVCLNDQGTLMLTKLFRVKQKHTPAWLPIVLSEVTMGRGRPAGPLHPHH
jgi:hypothetical protein